jgi:hypothetical protein
MAKISKNNPASRDNRKLIVYCPECDKEVKPTMTVTFEGCSQMVYKCTNENCKKQFPLFKKSYLDYRYEWVAK